MNAHFFDFALQDQKNGHSFIYPESDMDQLPMQATTIVAACRRPGIFEWTRTLDLYLNFRILILQNQEYKNIDFQPF